MADTKPVIADKTDETKDDKAPEVKPDEKAPDVEPKAEEKVETKAEEEVKAEVAKVEEKVKDSYIVLAHVLGGFDMQRGMLAFEHELGGLKNVERLLKNKSIAVSTSEEAVQAQQEFNVADAAVQRAKERGN